MDTHPSIENAGKDAVSSNRAQPIEPAGGSPSAKEVLRRAGIYCRTDDEAEEVLQLGIAKVVLGDKRLSIGVRCNGQLDEQVSEWLDDVLKQAKNRLQNLFHDLIRKEERQLDLLKANGERVCRGPEKSTFEIVAERDLVALVWKYVNDLPPLDKDIFEMKYSNEELSSAEIATTLGVSERTVRRKLNAAIKFIQSRFSNG